MTNQKPHPFDNIKISDATALAFCRATPPREVYAMARKIVGRDLTVPEFAKVLDNFYSA
jgi:hypothetical protein